jgi:hypothetical protein
MSLTKLSLAGNNLIIPGQEEFDYSDIPAGDGKNDNLFYSVGIIMHIGGRGEGEGAVYCLRENMEERQGSEKRRSICRLSHQQI